MQKEIHPIQAQILKELLLRESARFTNLKPLGIPSDQFTFHIKKLTEEGIVLKREDGSYALTLSGKEFANRFDIDSGLVKIERQAKIGVLIIATRSRDGVREYVMQQRLKHPFFGFKGFITGKVKWGESIEETAARELEEETGLKGEVTLKSVHHERIYTKEGELVEDKYFFICVAKDVTGVLVAQIEGGKNEWTTEEEFLKSSTFYDIPDLLALTKPGAPGFSEKSYTVEKY